MRLIAATLVTFFVAGCASSPATPTGSAAAPAVAPAAVSSKSGATTTSTAQPSTTIASRYPGYKVKQKNGQTYYCKKIAQIGSRFEDETCLTQAEMKTLMEQADSDRSMLRRSQNTCTMSGGANGGCGP